MAVRNSMSRLHELSVRLAAISDLPSILDEVLDAVMELQRADFGNVQLYDPARGTLEIAAHRGLGRDFLDNFHRLDAGAASMPGRALRDNARIIVEDVEADADFAPYREIAAAIGFRAVQSTPLFERRTGAPVGMLSTLFRKPHRPSERDLRLTDVYARQAADVIAFRLAARRLQATEERVRLALEAGRVGTWEWRVTEGTLIADRTHRSLFGLGPDEGPQPSEVYWARMVPEEIAAGVERAKEALKSGSVFQMEQRVTQADGTVRWMMSRGHARRDDPNVMIGVSYDVSERKRIEEALRQSEARVQAAIDLLGLGLYSWDPQTDTLDWDARVKAIWGLRPDAPVNYEIWRAGVHPDDLSRVEAAVERCKDPAGDGVYELEYRVIGADGEERWVAMRGRVGFQDGKPTGFLGVALDITARKQAEQQLRDSEACLAAILEQLPAGVGLFDSAGQLMVANEVFRRFTAADVLPSIEDGARARWRAFKPDGHLLDHSDYPGARALRGETVAPGIDFIHTSAAGQETWARVSAAPFRDESGRTAGVVAIVQDIDQEKRAAQALRESDERFRQFADHSSDILWISDARTRRVEYLSRAYESVSGRSRDPMPDHWMESIYPDDREGVSTAWDKARQGEPTLHQYRIARADGTVRWIRETVFPIRDQFGNVQRIGGIAEDITGGAVSLVYVVDDDETSRQNLVLLFQKAGYGTKAFASGAEFMYVAPVLAPGCVVFHFASRIDGLATLKQLKAHGSTIPVVVIGKSYGDVALVVDAMKAGAVDWLETPYAPEVLLGTVASTLADIRHGAEQSRDTEVVRARIASMSMRERQVLEELLAGGTNKVIGKKLGISPRTVELHRASVMERLGAETLPDAVLKATAAGVRPAEPSRKSKPPR